MRFGLARLAALALSAIAASACTTDGPTSPPDATAAQAVASGTIAAPSELSAAAAGISEIALAWRDNSSAERGFEIHRSTTGSTGVFTLFDQTSPDVTTYRNGWLTPSTEYCYKVRAIGRPKGKTNTYSSFSNTACTTTDARGVPAAPSNLVVRQHPNVESYAELAWTNNATDARGFRVERAFDAAGPWSVLPDFYFYYWTSNAGGVQHGLERHACYRVVAFSDVGSSDPSNVDCLTLPASPTELRAVAIDASTIDLTWTDNSSLETSQEILRSSSAEPGTTVVLSVGADVTSYRDAGLASDVTYTYSVVSRTADGVSSQATTASAPTASQAPATPTGLHAVPNSGTTWGYYEIYVGWSGTANTAEYRLWRSDDGGSSWTAYGATSINAAWDQGIVPDREHCYRVTAVNVAGESPPSDMDCAVIAAQPTILSWVETDGITEITWTDNSSIEDGYEIRTYSLIDGFVVTAWLPPNATSWRGYLPSQYNHAVVAVKDGGPQL